MTPPEEQEDRRSRSPTDSNASSVRDLMYDLDTRKRIREIRNGIQTEIDGMREDIAKCHKNISEAEAYLNNVPKGDLTEEQKEMKTRACIEVKKSEAHLRYCEDCIRRLKKRRRREIANVREEIDDERERERLHVELANEQQLGEFEEESIRNWDKQNMKAEQGRYFHTLQPVDGFRYGQQHNVPPPPPPQYISASSPQQPMGTAKSDTLMQLTTALQQAFGSKSNNVDRKLPSFSGDPSEWCNFYAAFQRSTAKYNYDQAENMMRLHDALTGNAKSSVEHLMANPWNIDRVLDTLARRFGRPEHVSDCLVIKAKACNRLELRKPETLIEFGTAVEALFTNICSYNQQDYMNNKQLVGELIAKLPPQWQENWFEFLVAFPGRSTRLNDFHAWLMPKVYAAELRVKPDEPFLDDKYGKGRKTTGTINTAAPASFDGVKPKQCVFCKVTGHSLDLCGIFKDKGIDEKWKIVKKLGVCFCCLRKGHRTPECRSIKNCGQNGCKKNHHILLYTDGRLPRTQNARFSDRQELEEYEIPPPDANDAGLFGSFASTDILPIIPVMVRGPKRTERVFALLDTGASFSMIEEEVATRLGLEGKQKPLNFTVFGVKRVENGSRCVSLNVAGDFKQAPQYPMKSVYTIEKLDLPCRTFDACELKRRFPHLSKMQAKSMKTARTQMVIGINYGGLFAAREILEAAPGETPAAIKCLLGWYVAHDPEIVEKQFQVLYKSNEDETLHNIIKKYFSTESFGVSVSGESNRSKEDKVALKQLEDNTTRRDKRWETVLRMQSFQKVRLWL